MSRFHNSLVTRGMKRFFGPFLSSIVLSMTGLCMGQTHPILFVTQVPVPADFTTVVATFGNHLPTLGQAPRGGDLWIRYPDGALKNLTAAAGYGDTGEQQGANAIAVRDPNVHWSGTKAIFSMVIGAPPQQYVLGSYNWELYEVTGLGPSDTPVITRVPNQPSGYNNISPTYGTNGRIIFTTDRVRDGSAHLYPQLDEYEEQPTVSGLWSLDPATGDLFIMEHSPSGSFEPFVDSFGRVIFTRWDHLQRDQQADGDDLTHAAAIDPMTNPGGQPGGVYGTFDYTDESAGALAQFGARFESLPEPRSIRTDLLAGTAQLGLRFNHFFPWMVFEDGTEMETLNHVGRHELHGFFSRSFSDDPALQDFNAVPASPIENFFQISEDATLPGRYLGTDAPEFATHASGVLIAINGAPSVNPEDMVITYLTHPDTADASTNPGSNHSGLYRDPIRTTDGLYISAHTANTLPASNIGTATAPASPFDFRIKTLTTGGNGYLAGGTPLTGAGIQKLVSWWSPDFLISYSGPLWELQPVEVVARTVPPTTAAPTNLPGPEANVFTQSAANLEYLRDYLRDRDLALIVVRDSTTRDDVDTQQPFHLRVDGDTATPPGAAGQKIYDVKYLQIYQGDQVRGIGLTTPSSTPRAGRRVLARPMHGGSALNATDASAPPGSVEISADGSIAAIVPARRALSWQLTASDGAPVVRERYWISFQPGEVRSCTSCHGLNKQDQAGRTTPMNEPLALASLLAAWQADLRPPDTHIVAVVPNGNGTCTLTINGPAGLAVTLQQSTNLMNWSDVTNLTLTGADEEHTATYPVTPGQDHRCFYRLALTP